MKQFNFFSLMLLLLFGLNSCNKKPDISIFKDFRSNIRQVAFSPDGKYLAVGGSNLRFFKTSNDTVVVNEFSDYTNVIKDMSFSKDGKYFATSNNDTLIKIYSVADNKFSFIKNLQGIHFSFSPDGKFIAISGGKNVKIFNLNDKLSLFKEIKLNGDIEKIKFGVDGKNLWIANDKKILQYSTSNFEQQNELKFKSYVRDFDIKPDGKEIAVVTDARTIIYTIDKKFKYKSKINGFCKTIDFVKFSPNNKFLFVKASTEENDLLLIYDATNKYKLEAFLQGNYMDLKFTADAQQFVTCKDGLHYYSMNLENLKPKFKKFLSLSFTKFFYDEDMSYDEEGTDYVDNNETLETLRDLFDIKFKRQFQKLFIRDDDSLTIYSYYRKQFHNDYSLGSILNFDVFNKTKYLVVQNKKNYDFDFYEMGYTLKELTNFSAGEYMDFFISPKDNYLIGYTNDSIVKIYDISDIYEIKELKKIKSSKKPVISPDESKLAISNFIYDLKNDTTYAQIDTISYFSAVFSPDNRYFITQSFNKVKFYDITDSFRLVHTFPDMSSVTFTSDGKYFILSGSDDNPSMAIYSIQDFTTPKKTFTIPANTLKLPVVSSYYYLPVGYYNIDEQKSYVMILDERFNFKQIDTLKVDGFLSDFIAAGYSDVYISVADFSDCSGDYSTVKIYYKSKTPQLLKEAMKQNPTSIFFAKGDNLIKFDKKTYKVDLLDKKDFKIQKTINLDTSLLWFPLLSPAGNFLCFSSLNNRLIVLSTDKLQQKKNLNDVNGFAFNNDDKYFIYWNFEGEINIYSTKNFKLIKTVYTDLKNVRRVAFSPQNKFLKVYGSDGNNLYTEILSVKNNYKKIATIGSTINNLKFGKNDKIFIYPRNNSLYVYKIGNKKYKYKTKVDVTNNIYRIDFSSNKNFIIIWTNKNAVVVNTSDFTIAKKEVIDYSYDYCVFDAKDKYCVHRNYKRMKVFSIKNNNFESIKDKQYRNLVGAKFSPDNKLLFAYGQDLEIYLLDKELRQFKTVRVGSTINKLEFSNSGKYFLLNTDNGFILYKK